MAELKRISDKHAINTSKWQGSRMPELKRNDDGREFVEVELSELDLYIVTHSLALYLTSVGKVVPLAGTLKRIGNTYYQALKASEFDIPKDDLEFWAKVGICPFPESDPAALIV